MNNHPCINMDYGDWGEDQQWQTRATHSCVAAGKVRVCGLGLWPRLNAGR